MDSGAANPMTGSDTAAGGFIIRDATAGDAAAIAAIHAASWQATYRGVLPEPFLATLTAQSRRPMWEGILAAGDPRIDVCVAVQGRQVLGFCSTGPDQAAPDDATRGTLFTIYVQPGREGEGIGHTLITEAERRLAARGVTTAVLAVLRDNPRARAFYERHGWVTDGAEVHDVIFGQPTTELVYHKRLVAGPE